MKNSVCYFTTEWPITMASNFFDQASEYFPKEFNLKVLDEYESLRWSKGLKGGSQNEVDKMYHEIFSEENIEAFEHLVYCEIILKSDIDCFRVLPSSGRTILTDDIRPTLIPSKQYPFSDWQLILKFTSKQYTILDTDFTDTRGSIYYHVLHGNTFAAGVDENKNEVLKIMVSRQLKTHLVASKEL